MGEDNRKVEVLNLSKKEWKEVSFKDIKEGDTFRMFEPDDGSPVTDNGISVFVARCDAYIDEESGVYSICIVR